MNNEPVAWINRNGKSGEHGYLEWDKDDDAEINTPLYTQDQLEEARKLGMQQERALWNLSTSTQEIMDTHPVKDREKDRLRFSDEAFNRWLDESISDSGHTVYDLVENVCEAWHGWENSQYYTHPVKELTDEEILILWTSSNFVRYTENGHIDEIFFNKFARAILRKAQSTCNGFCGEYECKENQAICKRKAEK